MAVDGSYNIAGATQTITLQDYRPGFRIQADPHTADNVSFTLNRAGHHTGGASVGVNIVARSTTLSERVTFLSHEDEQTLTIARDDLGSVGAYGGTITATIAPDEAYNVAAAPSNNAEVVIPYVGDARVSVSEVGVCEHDVTMLCITFERTRNLAALSNVTFTLGSTGNPTNLLTAATSVITTTRNREWLGYLSFGEGATTATVTLVRKSDTTVSDAQDLTVTLTAGTGYEIVGSPATTTLHDPDATPAFSITGVTSDDNNVTVTVTRVGGGTAALISRMYVGFVVVAPSGERVTNTHARFAHFEAGPVGQTASVVFSRGSLELAGTAGGSMTLTLRRGFQSSRALDRAGRQRLGERRRQLDLFAARSDGAARDLDRGGHLHRRRRQRRHEEHHRGHGSPHRRRQQLLL